MHLKCDVMVLQFAFEMGHACDRYVEACAAADVRLIEQSLVGLYKSNPDDP